MQNWETMQTAAANYEQHNTWYSNMFATTTIKSEPGTTSPSLEKQTNSPTSNANVMSHLKNYLKQQQQHHTIQDISTMDTLSSMTPSPTNTDNMQHNFDGNVQQQRLQQQQYQQQFQQAQQAASQNHVTSSHLPLGFNPLTPPGLPTAVLPSISHFYHNQSQTTVHSSQKTPSPQPHQRHTVTPMDSSDRIQSALTPRNTPPMDITPPKSPKSQTTICTETLALPEKEQDTQSNSSEDMKYAGESEDDESIRMPIYNSHGKMKNYKCKTCGMIAITKVSFWEHTRTHMKPEKILQCPKCPFVTELKHHLEYHIRKHKNLKPFQCEKCSYTCVNKSMLNSHRKSHSSVYQYRCSDCDYATKYCHSFKLHLRKYDHKPGLVLDEEGLPNPSVVIDVYGTRRGPKSKSSTTANKRSNSTANNNNNERLTVKSGHCQKNSSDLKLSATQLSTALQSFTLPTQQHQLPVSPAKSLSSISSDLHLHALGQQKQQQQQHFHQKPQQAQPKIQQQQRQQLEPNLSNGNTRRSTANATVTDANAPMSNLLPPLASILQQNPNMAFFPYWNLNIQMLAAQQQAAVLAQMSPTMREATLQQLQNQHSTKEAYDSPHEEDEECDEEDLDRKSNDSAMDLSHGSPVKEEIKHSPTPTMAINLKLQEESNNTPVFSNNGILRRKGRMLKLDAILQVKSAMQSPQQLAFANATNNEEHISAVPSQMNSPTVVSTGRLKENADACDESSDDMMVVVKDISTISENATSATNARVSSTVSSSGNSSNSSSATSATISNVPAAMYECKYCDIYFKDAVLYTIHMGYHSCDDVFKCNMCGEKCDGPVGLFVHMARNAHS